MLETAVSVLSQLPTRLEVLSEDGGAIALEITGHDAETIHALAPVAGVRVGLRLRLRERDRNGAGHDLDLRVSELFYESEHAATLHLTVERLQGYQQPWGAGAQPHEIAQIVSAVTPIVASIVQSRGQMMPRAA